MNNNRNNKTFNLFKYLTFPWGMLPTGIIWFGLCISMFGLWPNDANIDVLFKWEIIVLGLLVILFILIRVNFHLAPSTRGKVTVYILIAPEDMENDKYITNDFVDEIQEQLSRDNLNWEVKTPFLLARYSFNKRIKKYRDKGLNYFKSKSWQKTHSKLKGYLYLSGQLKTRSNEDEHLIFKLYTTVSYRKNTDSNIRDLVISKLYSSSVEKYTINKKYEYPQLALFSSQCTNVIEFLVGLTCFAIGDISNAYNIHKRLYIENRIGFKDLKRDVDEMTSIEIRIILDITCNKLDYVSALQYVEEYLSINPSNDDMQLYKARLLLLTCNENCDYDEAIKKATVIVNKVKIYSSNRCAIFLNKAYLSLLSKFYESAEEYYSLAFKKIQIEAIDSAIEYCENITRIVYKNFEKETAYYVKALLINNGKKDKDGAIQAYTDVLLNVEDGSYYSQKALEFLEKC